MTNIEKLQKIYNIIDSDELCAEAMVAEIGTIVDEPPTDNANDTESREYTPEQIHNAIKHGLEEYGIAYDTDGETYWVDLDPDGKNTYYIGIGECEK